MVSQMPPYIFRIDTLEEANNIIPLSGSSHSWIPSAQPGYNRLVGGGISGQYWECNGQQIIPIASLPAGSIPYKTFSVYFSEGSGFWALFGDASNITRDETWHKLNFDYEDDVGCSSFLTNAGQYATLRTQRNDQGWPHMLLPDIYHAPPASWTAHQQYGGLTGELPLFLALVAFSIHPIQVAWALQNCFTDGNWRVHNQPHGRTHKRGVVVRVWTYPGSTAQALDALESGNSTKYFH